MFYGLDVTCIILLVELNSQRERERERERGGGGGGGKKEGTSERDILKEREKE